MRKFFKDRKKLILFLVFCLAIFLRLYKINCQGLSIDESITWYRAIHLTNKQLWINSIINTHLPFYFLFMKSWVKFFGDSEFSLRFPSFIFSLGALFFFYKILNLFFKGGFLYIGVFLFSIATFNIDLAQEARMYAEAQFFFLMACYYLFLNWKNSFKMRYLIFYSLSVFLMISLGPPVLFAYLCLLIFTFYLSLKNKKYFIFCLMNLILIMPFLSLLIKAIFTGRYLTIAHYYLKTNYNFHHQLFSFLGWFMKAFSNFSLFSWTQAFASTNLGFITISILVILFFSLFILGLKKQESFLRWFILLIFFFSFFPFLLNYRFEVRYLWNFFPLVCISWIYGLKQLWRKIKIKKIFYIIILLWTLSGLKDLFYYFSLPKTGWREAVNYIKKNYQKGDQIWIFPNLISGCFYYYYGIGKGEVHPIQPFQEPDYNIKNSLWYVFWPSVRTAWIGGELGHKIDNYLRDKLSNIFSHVEIKYFLGRKGLIEIIHYNGKKLR